MGFQSQKPPIAAADEPLGSKCQPMPAAPKYLTLTVQVPKYKVSTQNHHYSSECRNNRYRILLGPLDP